MTTKEGSEKPAWHWRMGGAPTTASGPCPPPRFIHASDASAAHCPSLL